MKKIVWKKLAAPGQKAAVARTVLRDKETVPAHGHDFPEVFWVEDGAVWHEDAGGGRLLEKNSLAMIRPNDVHGYEAPAGGRVSFLNVALAPDILRHFAGRYFSGGRNFWGGPGRAPEVISLSRVQTKFLGAAAERLAAAHHSAFEADFFVMTLLGETGRRGRPFDFSRCPGWLAKACEEMRRPENFAEGPARLSGLAGRTAEHTARTLKASTGMTPVEMTNTCRMEHASVQLRMSDREIAEIAFECGFESLSHFYRVFRERFKSSPGSYRERNRASVIPR